MLTVGCCLVLAALSSCRNRSSFICSSQCTMPRLLMLFQFLHSSRKSRELDLNSSSSCENLRAYRSLALSNWTLSLSTAQPLIFNFPSYSHPDRACKSLGVPCRGKAATNVNSEFHRPPGYTDMSMKRINMKIVYLVPHD